MKKNQNVILGLGFISILLLIGIFNWGGYLIKNHYLQEPFSENENSYTTHNSDLPLTTSYSCSNKCGPQSRCSKTGQQCMADIDCPGCQPYSPPLTRVKENGNVRGENDAGKLGVQFSTFSTLTTDIGTQAKIFKANNTYKGAPQANFGPNTWRTKYTQEKKLFDERYVINNRNKPKVLTFMKKYPYRYTLSGEFLNNGPLASNAYIS
jgi:hypothetical protein